MIEHVLENNKVTIIGKVIGELSYSYKVCGERFYSFDLEVPRLSGLSDILPITISERLLVLQDNIQGKILDITGQMRSYNHYEENKNRVILTVFALEIKEVTEEATKKSRNTIYLNGFVCKAPVYRKTPFGREITDLLLAVNRSYNKSDYIPCITWGRNAKYAQGFKIGTHVGIWGRIQSRPYQKKLETGEVIRKIAYEVSIFKLEILEDYQENEKVIESLDKN